MDRYRKIPDELKRLNQWVCAWNTSKCPMQSNVLKAASPSKPETWSTFQDAEDSVEVGNYEHIGFVFHNNGLVGIDLDRGFDEYGLMTPQCADIVKRCRSYTEKSKSGRGVHIILKGDLPFRGKNNRQGVEIYKDGRFFITTGKQILYSEIAENQDAIDYVVRTFFSADERQQKRGKPIVQKVYEPVWMKPQKGHIPMRPEYPEILSGGRNLSLTSVAGGMWTAGFSRKQIYRELLKVNQTACKPPLSEAEVQLITKSITRYSR